MCTLNVIVEDKSHGQFKKCEDIQLRGELLSFWSRHPKGGFAVWAISYALCRRKGEINRVLRYLAAEGFLDVFKSNRVFFYSLTTDDEKRRQVLVQTTLNYDLRETIR